VEVGLVFYRGSFGSSLGAKTKDGGFRVIKAKDLNLDRKTVPLSGIHSPTSPNKDGFLSEASEEDKRLV